MRMRKIFNYCLLIISCAFCCCTTDKSDSIIVSDLDSTHLTFDASGGTKQIQFNATNHWSIVTPYDGWITFNSTEGESGLNTLVVTVGAINTSLQREATITIVCGNASKEILITQKGRTNALVNFNTINLDASGDTITIKVVGNTDFTAETQELWCQCKKINDNGFSCELSITVSANDSDTRSAYIYLKSQTGMILQSLSVKQMSQSEQLTNITVKTNTRSSLFMVFVATWCPFTTLMAEAFTSARESWQSGNVELVNVHVVDSELYCQESKELSQYYKNNTTPTGILDGRITIENSMNQSIRIFLTESKSILTNHAQIEGTAMLKNGEILAEIKLKALSVDDYALQVWLIEDNVVASQADGANDCVYEDYVHNCVLRKSLSATLGDEFIISEESAKHKIFTYSYSCAMPSHCNKGNTYLMAILQRKSPNNDAFEFPFYVDNCVIIPIDSSINSGGNENIFIGEDIEL